MSQAIVSLKEIMAEKRRFGTQSHSIGEPSFSIKRSDVSNKESMITTEARTDEIKKSENDQFKCEICKKRF